uniref:Uncharacterized protein n=1 Tax=viral metagenome TaxID=1070528 RepID=A0A6C0EM94_9ZZZZ
MDKNANRLQLSLVMPGFIGAQYLLQSQDRSETPYKDQAERILKMQTEIEELQQKIGTLQTAVDELKADVCRIRLAEWQHIDLN